MAENSKPKTGTIRVKAGVLPKVREIRKPDFSRSAAEIELAEQKLEEEQLSQGIDPISEESPEQEGAQIEAELQGEFEEFKKSSDRSTASKEPQWYVAHTYSGYENKVKINIEKTIENRHLEDQIFEVRIPMSEETEIRNGVRKTVSRKMFPGYVFVHMIMNEDTWYVVRNTRGVTGFVGPGSEPVWLPEEQIRPFDTESRSVDFAEGDPVKIIAGVWKDTIGKVSKIDYNKQSVTVIMEMFGRETPVEIKFEEVRRLS